MIGETDVTTLSCVLVVLSIPLPTEEKEELVVVLIDIETGVVEPQLYRLLDSNLHQ